jgi:hypothetical protein
MERDFDGMSGSIDSRDESQRATGPALDFVAFLVVLILVLWGVPVWGEEVHGVSGGVFGFDWSEGWLDPPVHSHFSPRGTPMIHSFRTEPAFMRRDLLLDYGFRSEAGGREQEIGAEIEWPLSRRLGLVFEMPYVFVDGEGEGSVDGFGNLAVSPRVLLAEYERFLLAFALEVETPMGDTDGGIAEDEVALAPSLSTWNDLGRWWALNTQSGVEHAVESNDSKFFFRSSLIHTFGCGEAAESDHTGHVDHKGLCPGLVSMIFEMDLGVDLSGKEDGEWVGEGIVGVLVGVSENIDLRFGYQFPLSRSEELNGGLIGGVICHF